MGKRQPISFSNGELVSNLKTSTGSGLDALSGTSQPEPEAPKKELVKAVKKEPKKLKKRKKSSK